ncbi:hypothetical protein LB505_003987 [Fusarium chuoi]|nr:hypothetical protein LB505_003987 [Fusarium chuoi]
MHFGIPPDTWAGTAGESIDVSKDLIIICRLPILGTTTKFPAVESIGALYEFNPTAHVREGSPFIPTNLEYPLENPARLLYRFPRLRVLYIIIQPRMIDPTVERMTNYHLDYTQTVNQVPPKTFNARQRVYYEVPQAITKTRGLELIYQRLVAFRSSRDVPPLVIRIMTWKNAPGVRGRFDRD